MFEVTYRVSTADGTFTTNVEASSEEEAKQTARDTISNLILVESATQVGDLVTV